MADQVQPGGLCQADDSRLGRAIDRHKRLTAAAGLACHIDDLAAFAAVDHVSCHRLHGEQRAGDIDLEQLLIVGAGDVGNRCRGEDRRVVDQDINSVKRIDGCGHRRIDAVLACHIHLDRDGGVADVGCHPAGAFDIDIGDGDARALAGIGLREMTADAPGRAGDQRRFASKPPHVRRSPLSSKR